MVEAGRSVRDFFVLLDRLIILNGSILSNHTGSHKINNAIGQLLLARRIGKTRIIAETGAGQHGVATATVCAKFGLECVVYMGAEDVRRQALNVFRIRMLGGKVWLPPNSHWMSTEHDEGHTRSLWIKDPKGCY